MYRQLLQPNFKEYLHVRLNLSYNYFKTIVNTVHILVCLFVNTHYANSFSSQLLHRHWDDHILFPVYASKTNLTITGKLLNSMPQTKTSTTKPYENFIRYTVVYYIILTIGCSFFFDPSIHPLQSRKVLIPSQPLPVGQQWCIPCYTVGE